MDFESKYTDQFVLCEDSYSAEMFIALAHEKGFKWKGGEPLKTSYYERATLGRMFYFLEKRGNRKLISYTPHYSVVSSLRNGVYLKYKAVKRKKVSIYDVALS